MNKSCIRLVAVLTSVFFVFSIMPWLSAGQMYTHRQNREVGIRIPFGYGSQPQNKGIIETLKEEETEGAGAAIGLIILGACIVAAAVIIANKADDVKEDLLDEADDVEATIETKYDELQKEKEEHEDKYE